MFVTWLKPKDLRGFNISMEFLRIHIGQWDHKHHTCYFHKSTALELTCVTKVKRLRRRQYDPGIIERTIGLVLGPSTALYEPFLKHCILTNKAVGTMWRALSKPPQRRHGPDLCPLWLLVGTPSAIRPELAFIPLVLSRFYFQPGGAQPALFGCR